MIITKEVSMKLSKEKCLNIGLSGSSFEDGDYLVFNLDYNGAICAANERRSRPDTNLEEMSKNKEANEVWIEEFVEMALIQSNGDSISTNGTSSRKSSFSFPILNWRAVDSPTRMPVPKTKTKPKETNPIKLARQKLSFPILSCCKF